MSKVTQCDRCKKLIEFNFDLMEMVKNFKIRFSNTILFNYDFCKDCSEKFKKFIGEDEKMNLTDWIIVKKKSVNLVIVNDVVYIDGVECKSQGKHYK